MRNIEDAMGAMRSLHQMLVQRFVELHGSSACDTLASETEELRGEIMRELADRRAASAASGTISPSTLQLRGDDGEEYDPDDVEEVAVHDSTGIPTGTFRPKLFAPPLAGELIDAVEIVRASHHSEGSACIICQEDICYGQKLCRLPICGHQLCTSCGFEWLSICGSCPVCRRIISAADFILEDTSSTPNSFCSAPATPLSGTKGPMIPTIIPTTHVVEMPVKATSNVQPDRIIVSSGEHLMKTSHGPHRTVVSGGGEHHSPLDFVMDSIMIPTASVDTHHRPDTAASLRDGGPTRASPIPTRPSSCSRLPRTQPSSLPTDSPAPFSSGNAVLKRPASSSVASLRTRVATAAIASIFPTPVTVVTSPQASRQQQVGTSYDIFSLPDRRWVEPKTFMTRPSSAQPPHQRVIMTAPPPRPQLNPHSAVVDNGHMKAASLLGEAVRFSITTAPVGRSPLVLAPSVQLYHPREPPRGVVPLSTSSSATAAQPSMSSSVLRSEAQPYTAARPTILTRPQSATTAHHSVGHVSGQVPESHRVIVAAKERPASGAFRRPPPTSAAALASRRSHHVLPSYGAQKRHQRPSSAMSLTVDGTSLSRAL